MTYYLTYLDSYMKFTDEHIEQYLNGNMSRTAILAFERKMQEDDEFASEVHLHQILIKGILYTGFCRNIFSESIKA